MNAREERWRRWTQYTAERFAVMPPAISETLAAKLAEHPGRWVAVEGDELVAVGDDVIEVILMAAAAGVLDPIVFPVQHHPKRPFFGHLVEDTP